MTKLHFNYKDVFRSLRLGFSAKKVWMMSVGLMIGFVGYSILTYLACLIAGGDFLTLWETYRLFPVPDPAALLFPWYSWALFALGAAFLVCCVLVAGTAVSKVAYEQLRGDEFYESREAFRFALRRLSSVLGSPLLIAVFVAIIAVFGLLLGLLGRIPYFGDILIGLMALPGLAASFFILYLLVVLLFSLLLAPSVVGSTRNDMFDTIFEVFSCVNEQPARLVLYTTTTAGLAKAGSFLFGLASSAAVRIGSGIVGFAAGGKMPDLLSDAGYYLRVYLPDWVPDMARAALARFTDMLGLQGTCIPVWPPVVPQASNWGGTVGSLFLGFALYVIVLMVLAFGCSVWYSGCTLTYTVLAKKKDDKNLIEQPDDDKDLLEPVTDIPGPGVTAPEQPEAK